MNYSECRTGQCWLELITYSSTAARSCLNLNWTLNQPKAAVCQIKKNSCDKKNFLFISSQKVRTSKIENAQLIFSSLLSILSTSTVRIRTAINFRTGLRQPVRPCTRQRLGWLKRNRITHAIKDFYTCTYLNHFTLIAR